VVAQELVPDAVELVGGHARLHVRPDQLTRLGGQAGGEPDALDGVGVLDLGPGELLRRRLVDVLRPRDAGGHRAARRDHGGSNGRHAGQFKVWA
jgi:hypothetical protein